jgi:serine/threonine protein kinase
MTSIDMAKDGTSSAMFQLPVARAVAAQLVQAVAYLHSRGVVHGGKS